MIEEVIVDIDARGAQIVTFESTIFLRPGETLHFEGNQPVIDRLDATQRRPRWKSSPYCGHYLR